MFGMDDFIRRQQTETTTVTNEKVQQCRNDKDRPFHLAISYMMQILIDFDESWARAYEELINAIKMIDQNEMFEREKSSADVKLLRSSTPVEKVRVVKRPSEMETLKWKNVSDTGNAAMKSVISLDSMNELTTTMRMKKIWRHFFRRFWPERKSCRHCEKSRCQMISEEKNVEKYQGNDDGVKFVYIDSSSCYMSSLIGEKLVDMTTNNDETDNANAKSLYANIKNDLVEPVTQMTCIIKALRLSLQTSEKMMGQTHDEIECMRQQFSQLRQKYKRSDNILCQNIESICREYSQSLLELRKIENKMNALSRSTHSRM